MDHVTVILLSCPYFRRNESNYATIFGSSLYSIVYFEYDVGNTQSIGRRRGLETFTSKFPKGDSCSAALIIFSFGIPLQRSD